MTLHKARQKSAVKRDEKHEFNAFARAQRVEKSFDLEPPYGDRVMLFQDGSAQATEGEKVYTGTLRFCWCIGSGLTRFLKYDILTTPCMVLASFHV